MRDALRTLIENTISLEFVLPCDDINKISISTLNDYCLKRSSDEDIVNLIYNSIVDNCLNESEINLLKLNDDQIYALKNRMRFDESDSHDTQIKYGFYGENLLNILLSYLFETKKIIAKGYFFSPIENSESKGYDNFHFLKDEEENIELWFGEAKMYQSLKDAITKVLDNIDKALSINYLDKNVRAIISRANDLDDTEISPIIREFRNKIKNENINIWDEIRKRNITVTYPIFISYECKDTVYKNIIHESLTIIEDKIKDKKFTNEISAKILFILLPVKEMKKIKEEVLECIYQKKSII